MIFDGECGFCRYWVRRWKRYAGHRIEYVPFQHPAMAERFPEIARDRFASAVHFIEPDGQVSCGAEAIFRSFVYSGRSGWPKRFYETVPLFARLSDWAYGLVANHRRSFSILARMLGWVTGSSRSDTGDSSTDSPRGNW